MTAYRVKRPGDILYLQGDLPGCENGYYVLLSIGDFCTLAELGEHHDGTTCASSAHVIVSFTDLSFFEMTGLEVDPL